MIDYPRLIQTLIRHEGLKTKPYKCSAGKLTIGVGRNLEDNGITEEEALILCRNDIANATKDLVMLIPDFWMLDSVRQEVLINMMYNLGFNRFANFKLMIVAVNSKDFRGAAAEMLNSTWAIQVKGRATELSDMMRTGLPAAG